MAETNCCSTNVSTEQAESQRIHDRAKSGGGESSPKTNVGDTERWLSIAGGAWLVLNGLLRRRVGVLRTMLGGALLYRGFSGHCSAYQALGVDSTGQPSATAVPSGQGRKVERSITIDRPVEELFRFWRKLENLPQIMSHLESVRQLDQRRSHWVARGPAGTTVAWDAEILNERPNEMIAWKSVEPSQLATAGSVHFEPAEDRQSTVVRVSLKYDPPGGRLGAVVADLFGASPEKRLQEDLEKFKSTMESETDEMASALGARAANI